MAYEVECKAWIKDKRALLQAISARGRFLRHEEKEDLYFGHKRGQRIVFRLRSVNGKDLITIKKKRISQGMEVNRELEFAIPNREEFLQFMGYLGYLPLQKKQKSTDLFEVDGLSVEVNTLKGLGEFLEIELVCEHREEVPAARERIFELFASLGIARSDLEERSYRHLLDEKEQKD